ncbi:hypothetical protein EDB83DRAFT_2317887 [Lactarius deliciosus]|nr:hypothetical protein EDB83DRAFT_2317887 [Lactarius deliciosus]
MAVRKRRMSMCPPSALAHTYPGTHRGHLPGFQAKPGREIVNVVVVTQLSLFRQCTRESILTSYHATPGHAVCSRVALRARKSLAMHFATFAGSDVEALNPILEPEQAEREMVMMPTGGDDVRRTTTAAVGIGGGWWMKCGMGVGETATGDNPISFSIIKRTDLHKMNCFRIYEALRMENLRRDMVDLATTGL